MYTAVHQTNEYLDKPSNQSESRTAEACTVRNLTSLGLSSFSACIRIARINNRHLITIMLVALTISGFNSAEGLKIIKLRTSVLSCTSFSFFISLA